VVIDQLEELFTQTADDAERRASPHAGGRRSRTTPGVRRPVSGSLSGS
jgi:hypothetical protein